MKLLIALLLLDLGAVTQTQLEWQDRTLGSGTNEALVAAMVNADGWFAYQVPAVAGTHSPCCWTGWGEGYRTAGGSCSLDRRNNAHGSNQHAPISATITIYVQLEQGVAQRLLTVGEHCRVVGSATVNRLLGVSEQQSLTWLQGLLTPEAAGHLADAATHTIALHHSARATEVLEKAAAAGDRRRAKQAAFWLGQKRGEAGLEALARLLESMPDGEPRRQLAFSVSQSDAAGAAQLLLEIARSDADPRHREQAWFWLAQEYPQRAAAAIPRQLADNPHQAGADQLVFALSQLPDELATPALLSVARSPLPTATRKRALFWLAQSDDPRALDALTEALR